MKQTFAHPNSLV